MDFRSGMQGQDSVSNLISSFAKFQEDSWTSTSTIIKVTHITWTWVR
jgi:hypothetical protein